MAKKYNGLQVWHGTRQTWLSRQHYFEVITILSGYCSLLSDAIRVFWNTNLAN